MNEVDEVALHYAGIRVGEYIDELGRTDLASYSFEEWSELLKIIICRYQEKAAE